MWVQDEPLLQVNAVPFVMFWIWGVDELKRLARFLLIGP